MSEYLVRWKCGPNSLLNHQDVETSWYQQFFPDKDKALNMYTTMVLYSVPAMALTAEIFELVPVTPGEEIEVVTIENAGLNLPRDQKIRALYKEGYTRKEIGEMFDLKYHTVYGITGPNKK